MRTSSSTTVSKKRSPPQATSSAASRTKRASDSASAKKAAPRNRQQTSAEQGPPTMMEAQQPGPEHEALAACTGTWEVACTCWMQEGEPPLESTGTSRLKMVYDGRFLREEFSGTFAGKPFSGTGTTGYDRAAAHFVMTWHDSMSTGIICLTGSASADGREITYHGSMVCPQRGPVDLRHVMVKESDDRFTVTMFNRQKGKEHKAMELIYTRKG